MGMITWRKLNKVCPRSSRNERKALKKYESNPAIDRIMIWCDVYTCIYYYSGKFSYVLKLLNTYYIRMYVHTKLSLSLAYQCNISGSVPVRKAEFGEGSGPILLDNLMCTEDESEASLLDCVAPEDIGVHNCEHSEDAGVRCEGIYVCMYPHMYISIFSIFSLHYIVMLWRLTEIVGNLHMNSFCMFRYVGLSIIRCTYVHNHKLCDHSDYNILGYYP